MLEILVVLGSILVDQLTKAAAAAQLTVLPGQTLPVIGQVLHLTYCENTGAAFSIFANNTLPLTILVCVLVVILGFIMVKFRHTPSKLLKTSLALIMGGAIGNLIDRIVLGYVVDFIDFRIINFAVFNVADICVCVGTALLALYVIFFEKKKKELKRNE